MKWTALILLVGLAVAASTCSQEDRLTGCVAARVALQIAQNHGADAETLAALQRDADLLCTALTPAQEAEVETRVEAVVED